MFVQIIIKVAYLPCVVILIPKHSFCKTVCVCMVMQIKLVVGADVLFSREKNSEKPYGGGIHPPRPPPPLYVRGLIDVTVTLTAEKPGGNVFLSCLRYSETSIKRTPTGPASQVSA